MQVGKEPASIRNLRIIKLTPIALGVCEACNMRFKSHQPIEDNAEAEMKAAFEAHACQHEEPCRP